MTEDELTHAVTTLSRGGVVAAATETLFGLLADAGDPSAVGRVFALKGRDGAKGVALLLPDRRAWGDLVAEVPPAAAHLVDIFWPGPLTLALPSGRSLDPRLTVHGTVGVRWPGPSDAARIAHAFGRPVTATSANATGSPPARTPGEVVAQFEAPLGAGELTLVTGTAPGGPPSTLVTIAGDEVRLVRPGAISQERLIEALAGTPYRLVITSASS